MWIAEFSQEVASEGLGVIFELGSEDQKKVMVEELVNILSVGRKRVDPVAPDTLLFAKGELSTASMGSAWILDFDLNFVFSLNSVSSHYCSR